jgi:hypothetical protein
MKYTRALIIRKDNARNIEKVVKFACENNFGVCRRFPFSDVLSSFLSYNFNFPARDITFTSPLAAFFLFFI